MKKKANISNRFKFVFFGIVLGVINGLFGGGGGMIAVPALESLLLIDNKKAHATSLFVMFPLTVCSAVIYIVNNNILNLNLLYCLVGVIGGAIVGALLLKKLMGKTIRCIFFIIIFFASLKIMVK